MSEHAPPELEASPAGEHIHMPAPSLLPVINAAGLALSIVAITLSHVLLVIGLTVFGVSTALWIRSTARDVKQLPRDHH